MPTLASKTTRIGVGVGIGIEQKIRARMRQQVSAPDSLVPREPVRISTRLKNWSTRTATRTVNDCTSATTLRPVVVARPGSRAPRRPHAGAESEFRPIAVKFPRRSLPQAVERQPFGLPLSGAYQPSTNTR